jgi:hypothetical protein
MIFTLIILVVLMFIVYIQLSMRISDKFTILQTTAETILPEHVIEKIPILVHDRIVDPVQLVRTVFKYQFMSIKQCIPINKKHSIKCSYYVIHAKGETCNNNNVFIQHPKMSNIVNCKLDKHSVLLIPRQWIIKLGNPNNFNVFECHTTLTKLFCLYKV